MDISFIIVNYQSEDHLKRCLLSLRKNIADLTYEVIIVNNDATPLTKLADLENIKVIDRGTNDGFAKACNAGAVEANGEFLFFLNPDTELLTSNISELFDFFNLRSEAGIVAPRLTTDSGSIQKWSVGATIGLWDILRNNFGFTRSKVLWEKNGPTEVAWVSGAALAIKKDFFDSLFGFDENFFMYFEDVDLCKRAADQGKKIFLLPAAQVLHLGGKSNSSATAQKKQYYTSQDYYFKKHFGSFKLFLLQLLRKISLFLKK